MAQKLTVGNWNRGAGAQGEITVRTDVKGMHGISSYNPDASVDYT